MEFQFGQTKLLEMACRVLELTKREEDYVTLGQCLDAKIKDLRERHLMEVAIIVLNRLHEARRGIRDVDKVICWRSEDGKPEMIQIEFLVSKSRLSRL